MVKDFHGFYYWIAEEQDWKRFYLGRRG